jgi:beta-lactamase superfamily II metal-dependent hydrolase
MSTIKSYAVGNGDTFYIDHNSDNFTIIDCHLPDEHRATILNNLKRLVADKGIVRFISTHPDEDHLKGLKALDEKLNLRNFYCVKNATTKSDETEDFKHYCTLRDSSVAFHIKKGCSRRWMNLSDEERKTSGLQVLWPDLANNDFRAALKDAEGGGSPNNISAIITYAVQDCARFMWLGDLETDYMEAIADEVDWPKVHILFAAHHGRLSGRVPHVILDKIKPDIIILGEAPSRHLHYYGGYNTITQNTAGDITFECLDNKVHVFVSAETYYPSHLKWLPEHASLHGDTYIGSLVI